MGFGSIIVSFPNVWSGTPLVLTVFGWSQVLKGLIYFLFPHLGLRGLQTVSLERTGTFIYPGIVFLILAGLLAYHLAAAGSA